MTTVKVPLTKEKESIIDKAYRDPMYGMGSGYILYKHLREQGRTYDKINNPDGITVGNVKDFLSNQETNQVLANRKRNTGGFVAEGPLEQFQIDLVYMPKSWFNHGYKYIFCCVDVFSKKADMVPMKERDAETSTAVMKQIIKNIGIPKSIYSDQGSEFNNTPFLALMKKHDITVIFAIDHAPFVEAFNKTMKNRMYKYMAIHQTDDWASVIKVLLDAYNKTPHSSTGIAPDDINKNNVVEARMNMLKRTKIKEYEKLKPGDSVRVPVIHKQEKGYKQQWTYETLKIGKDFQNGVYEIDGTLYPRKELLLMKSAPTKNIPLEPNIVKKKEKENKIGTAQESKLIKELVTFNKEGNKDKTIPIRDKKYIQKQLEQNGPVLRSQKAAVTEEPKRVLRERRSVNYKA